MEVNLRKAIKTVSLMDASSQRLKLFDDVKKRSFFIFLMYNSYILVEKTFFGPLAVCAYGLKSFLCIIIIPQVKGGAYDIMAAAVYPNEQRSIGYIEDIIKNYRFSKASFGLKNLLNVKNLLEALTLLRLSSCLKYYSIIKRHSRRCHFVTLCQIAKTISSYIRFNNIFNQTKPKAIIFASAWGPEAQGLNAAARKHNIIRIFVSHAVAPFNNDDIRLDADLAIVEGLASREVFQKSNTFKGTFAYKGISLPQKNLNLDLENKPQLSIGIFLGSLTNITILEEIILYILANLQVSSIIIRPHPVKLLAPSFTTIMKLSSKIEICANEPILNSINKCDIVIAGNTGAHLETLKSGVPTVYVKGLDNLMCDYYGYIEKKVVFSIEHISQFSLSEIKMFYSRDWTKRFSYFDDSYMKDALIIEKQIRDAIEYSLLKVGCDR